MFSRTIAGKDIVYKMNDEPIAAVLDGKIVSEITDAEHNHGLRYLVINKAEVNALKEKQLKTLLNMAKSKDGVNSLVEITKYRFVQTGPKKVVLHQI